MKTTLLLIDPQNDFCNPDGALYVTGAEKDCERTAKMIDRLGKKLYNIYATFDSHSQYQIFHPLFWRKSDGSKVAPFTQITHNDIISGSITPTDVHLLGWCKEYTKKLEDGGRYPLIIWPYHCLIGSPGWCMNPLILSSIHQWERDNIKIFKPITKGSSYLTEHYSAVKAEVVVPEDPTTHLNTPGIIKPLEESDKIILMGQARSHCLANTVRDIMASFKNPEYIKKLYIAEDGTSDVTGFEQLGDAFFDDFLKAGGNITTTDKINA
jgi:nicotinamidase/pyrazinamidase